MVINDRDKQRSDTFNPFWKRMFSLALLMCVGVFVVRFLFKIEGWGHFIPQDDLLFDYATACIWSVVFGLSIFSWPVPQEDKSMLVWAWVAKVFVVLGVMLLYENHYFLDAYEYYERAMINSNFDWSVFWGTPEGMTGAVKSSQIMANFILLLRPLLSDSYHSLKLGFSMVGLIAIYLFYRTAIVFLGDKNRRLFFALAFFPSILFWSSILGKEPITFLGMSLYAYGIVCLYKTQKRHYLTLVIMGIVLESLIRIWYGVIMVIPLTIFVLSGLKNKGMRLLFIALFITVFCVFGESFMNRFKIDALLDVLDSLSTVAQGYATTPGGSNINVSIDLTSRSGIISYIPIGMFTALFRPLPGEVMNPFGFLTGLENLYLLILLYLSVKRTRLKELKNPLFLWAISLIFLWAFAHAFILNMGTLVRFKLQIMPVLFCLLLYLSRKRSGQTAFPLSSH